MTGEEHAQKAEQLSGARGEWYYVDADEVPAILARAQVHATLALVDAVKALAPKPVRIEMDGFCKNPPDSVA
jgi:hypothetical protein